jgi:hypothetical protein
MSGTPHLAFEELRRWRDDPDPADRARIIGHLASCDACGGRLAELMRTAPLTDVPEPAFDTAGFEESGYRVRQPAATGGWRAGIGMRVLAPLAAAAVLVLAIGTYVVRSPAPADRVVRGGGAGVELIAPTGRDLPRDELKFEWKAEGATAFALRVYDLGALDAPVIEREDVGSGYVPGDAERQRLKPGVTYRWFVEYRTPAGGTAASPAATFSVR